MTQRSPPHNRTHTADAWPRIANDAGGFGAVADDAFASHTDLHISGVTHRTNFVVNTCFTSTFSFSVPPVR